MKTSGIVRFCSAWWRISNARHSRRTTAALLAACLLFTAVPAAARSPFGGFDARSVVRSGVEIALVSEVARRLAKGVKRVQKRFEEERRKLPVEKGASGQPAYRRQDVTGLIGATATDLDRAIEEAGQPGLVALRDWARAELEDLQSQAREEPAQSWLHAVPHPIALVASLNPFSSAGAVDFSLGAEGGAGGPAYEQGTMASGTASKLLDAAGDVLKRILGLAKKKDLQIDVVVTIVPVRGDVVLFPPSQLGKPNVGERASGGQTLRLWRGGYLYELRGAPHPIVNCPAAGQQDWRFCFLDLVSAPNGASILCNLKPPTPTGAGCCGLTESNCGR